MGTLANFIYENQKAMVTRMQWSLLKLISESVDTSEEHYAKGETCAGFWLAKPPSTKVTRAIKGLVPFILSEMITSKALREEARHFNVTPSHNGKPREWKSNSCVHWKIATGFKEISSSRAQRHPNVISAIFSAEFLTASLRLRADKLRGVNCVLTANYPIADDIGEHGAYARNRGQCSSSKRDPRVLDPQNLRAPSRSTIPISSLVESLLRVPRRPCRVNEILISIRPGTRPR